MRLTIPITLAAAATAALAPTVAAAPPSNDAFDSPETTTGSLRGAFTEEGTRQDGEPEHGFKSLWYAYRAPASGRMAVQPAPGQDSATATVYEGERLSTIRRVSELEQDIQRTTFEAVAGARRAGPARALGRGAARQGPPATGRPGPLRPVARSRSSRTSWS